jgi:hypothetical protein
MKKRLFPYLGLFTFAVMIVMALTPLSASAASLPAASLRKPHLLLRSTLLKSSAVTPLASGNLSYHGGPVMTGTANAYAIFWEPTGNVATNYNSLIQRYFGDIGGSSLYHNNIQYTNSSGGFASNASFAASWVDTRAYPRSPLLDSDLQSEVSHALSTRGWRSSINNIFFVFTQRSENICIDSSHTVCASNFFCAYHSSFGSNTLYAAMPYAASFQCNPGHSPNHNDADQTINVTSHEQIEAATDPLGNAWYDSTGSEIGDKCAWIFGSINSSGGDVTWNGHNYIVQEEWDNRVRGCVLSGP